MATICKVIILLVKIEKKGTGQVPSPVKLPMKVPLFTGPIFRNGRLPAYVST